jgi:uncharacterized membrane protein
VVGAKRAEQQIVIEGSPQACFDAITDYETFPEWQQAVTSCKVISRDAQGRGKEVAFEVDAKVKSVYYRLSYRYEEPHLITWDYLEGDVNEIDGEYVFEDRGDGTTLATYSLHIHPGVWVPGRVGKALNQQVMQGSMEDLKRRVESR